MTRLAAIDLGTNTVRLLVVDVDRDDGAWRTLEHDQRVTRLGEGLAGSGSLRSEAMDRTAATVVEYVDRARWLGATDVWIVATSAVREATNGVAFAAALEAKTGRAVSVVSGADEARLTLAGVRRGLGRVPGVMVVFDIGGGSTEFTVAHDGVLRAAVSLRLGVVPLAERFPFPGAVDHERYAALATEIRRRLEEELPATLRAGPIAHLVGTAGTVTTLAALDLGLASYDAARVHGHVLERRAIDALLDWLGRLTVGERAALPCLEPGRADLIVPGTAVVRETMTCFGCDRLTVSDSGLREGLISELATRLRAPSDQG